MKLRFSLSLALVLLCALLSARAASAHTVANHNTINAILGDVSFVQKFGTAPTAAANERTRIQTHLEYVERLLRAADVSHLPKPLRERRAALLDNLHEYRLAGCFPTNLAFPKERRPCFIDAAGNICAVGYLIEQTAGRALAERINVAHQYDFLTDMQLPELTAWVAASGLTARECAMIQPSYGPPQLDPNCQITVISPLTTSATGTAYTRVLKVAGILDRFYRPNSPGPGLGIYFTSNIPNVKYLLELATTATLRERWRWDGTITMFIPAESNVTSGTYSITLTTVEPVGERYYNSVSFFVSPATSIRDLMLPIPITISPNPVHEALTLALPENDLHRVRLTNALGTAVATLSEASGTTTLDVSGLAAGVYFVEVESARTRQRTVQKVVKY